MTFQIKTMILLFIAAMLFAGCAAPTGAQKSADIVAKAAARIADFTLPDGYRPEYTLTIAGFTIVSYIPGDDHSHLFFVQAPADYAEDQAKLEEALRQAQSGDQDRTTRMTVVEKRAVTIRGQETTLVISDGASSDDQPYRQATATFHGKNGPALLVISEPLSRWDDARISQFIASIK